MSLLRGSGESLSPYQIIGTDNPLRVVAQWDSSSTDSLELAQWLSTSLPIRIQVVASYSPSEPSSKKNAKKRRRAAQEFRETATKTLKNFVDKSSWAEEPTRIVASSSKSSSLVEAARDFDADMILLGSKARKPKGNILSSFLAGTVLDSCAVPVVLAPKHLNISKKGVTRVNYIFLGSDGFNYSSDLENAAVLASHLGVPLRLIAMSPEPLGQADFDSSAESPGSAARRYEDALGALDHAHDRAIAALAGVESEIDVETCLALGYGWKKAVTEVKWKKGDLTCVSSRPQSQINRVFSKVKTSEFLTQVPTPTLIFPARRA